MTPIPRYHYSVDEELDMIVQTALASRSRIWRAYARVLEVER